MSGKTVFIPCRLDRRDARHALIEDADGWPRKVLGPIGRADGRLVVVAQWLREASGRHQVRFDDGQRLWVTYGPRPDTDFVRFGSAARQAAIPWASLVTFPLMAAVQYTCAKVALESGHGVAGVLRGHYPRLLYPVVIGLVAANVFNAAADLAAVAEGVGLLVPVLPSLLVLPIGLGLLAFQVWGSYRRIACTFKWLTLSLLAYVGAAFLSGPD